MFRFSFTFSLIVWLFANTASWAQPRHSAPSRRPSLFSQTSIEKAWQVAARQQQPMLVMFTSEHCRFCKKMLAETYGHPAIEQMLVGRAQTVLAHSDNYAALVKRLGIRGFPTSVLISPRGDVLDLMEGYVPPKDFAKRVSPIFKAHLAQQARQRQAQTQPAPARAAQLPVPTTGR